MCVFCFICGCSRSLNVLPSDPAWRGPKCLRPGGTWISPRNLLPECWIWHARLAHQVCTGYVFMRPPPRLRFSFLHCVLNTSAPPPVAGAGAGPQGLGGITMRFRELFLFIFYLKLFYEVCILLLTCARYLCGWCCQSTFWLFVLFIFLKKMGFHWRVGSARLSWIEIVLLWMFKLSCTYATWIFWVFWASFRKSYTFTLLHMYANFKPTLTFQKEISLVFDEIYCSF